MYRRFWLIPIAVLGTTLLYRHHSSLKQIRANVRAFDLLTAEIYDALVASPLGGFYARVTDEVTAACPSGTLLESAAGRVGLPYDWLVPPPVFR